MANDMQFDWSCQWFMYHPHKDIYNYVHAYINN